jgi:oxalate decarboxylase
VPADTFKKILLNDLYIFQGEMSGSTSTTSWKRTRTPAQRPLRSLVSAQQVAPTRKTAGGMVQIADSRNFKAAKTIAAVLVTIT